MKIKNINIKDSQVNFADKIDSINYNQNTSVNESQFEDIKKTILSLSNEEKAVLLSHHKEIVNDANIDSKMSKMESVKAFLIRNGSSMITSVSANAIYEVLKTFLV